MSAARLLTGMIALALLASIAQAQTIDEARFVNRLLDDFSTPSIVPGHSGLFYLTVNHPDALNLTSSMENVTLVISIYRYATLEESLPVAGIDTPPIISESGSPDYIVDCGNILPGNNRPVEFTIETDADTPHGSYFSQSTYFVRFVVGFQYEGVNYSMASRGYFDDAQWLHLTETETGAGEINQTYLEELGYDGIIPDSAFSVKIPIPRWPFYGLVAGTGFVGFLALASYVLDNPGSYPRLELRLLRLKGQLDLHRRRLIKRFRRD